MSEQAEIDVIRVPVSWWKELLGPPIADGEMWAVALDLLYRAQKAGSDTFAYDLDAPIGPTDDDHGQHA
jgi:hypothetical protein